MTIHKAPVYFVNKLQNKVKEKIFYHVSTWKGKVKLKECKENFFEKLKWAFAHKTSLNNSSIENTAYINTLLMLFYNILISISSALLYLTDILKRNSRTSLGCFK